MRLRSRNISVSKQVRRTRKRSRDVSPTRPEAQPKAKQAKPAPPELTVAAPADRAQPAPVKAALTKSNLSKHTKLMARMGSPRANDSDVTSTTTWPPTSNVTSTQSNFVPALGRNGIIVDGSEPPDDLANIKAVLRRRRNSACPVQDDFEDYKAQNYGNANEATVILRTWFLVAKRPKNPFFSDGNCPWNNYDNESPPTNQLICPQKPDYTQSLRIAAYPFPVVDDLGGFLQPSEHTDMALPHFAAEFKRASLAAAAAQFQCAYNGAAMLHAHRVALDFLEEPFPYGQTIAFTAAFTGKALLIFAHHMKQKEGKDVYFAHCVGSYHLHTFFDEFKEGRLALRNVQTFAENQDQRLLQALEGPRPTSPQLTPGFVSAPSAPPAVRSFWAAVFGQT